MDEIFFSIGEMIYLKTKKKKIKTKIRKRYWPTNGRHSLNFVNSSRNEKHVRYLFVTESLNFYSRIKTQFFWICERKQSA